VDIRQVMDTNVFIVLLLFAGVMLRVVLIGLVAWFIVPRRKVCPHCHAGTMALVTSPVLGRLRLQRRWCVCGWSGLSKRIPVVARDRESGVPAPFVFAMMTVGFSTACAPPDDPVRQLFTESERWVDLTHAFDENAVYWPTARPFALDTVSWGMTDGGYFYSAFNFTAAEHGGTHLDAPIHFAEGRQAAHEIPLDRLIGPAVVVDVSARVGDNADYLVSVEDLEAFEDEHGRIPDGSILLLDTGWGRRWSDPEAYLGTTMTGPEAVPQLHFPGLDPDAARWLVEQRAIAAIGIDTPSIDYGQSTTFESHRILYEQNIPGFENVANLESMPVTGGYVVALPMKIRGGSGGPLRIVGAR
jgi:kynurenine formamidase